MRVALQATKKAFKCVLTNVYAGKRLTQGCQHDSRLSISFPVYYRKVGAVIEGIFIPRTGSFQAVAIGAAGHRCAERGEGTGSPEARTFPTVNSGAS